MAYDRQDYNIAKIRELLTDAFTTAELRSLCYYHPALRPIVDRIAPGLGLVDMVDHVVEYCEKHLLFAELLSEVSQANPRQYRRYLPALGSAVPPLPGSICPGPGPRVSEARLSFEPEVVSIPAGPFLMGSTRPADEYETPQHQVLLPAFEIGRYPVTNYQYSAFLEATGHQPPATWYRGRLPQEQAHHPVVYISWHDAWAYVSWLREQTGRPYRLPSEAEWEKAARGIDGRLWPWGNIWDPSRANCKPAGPGGTTEVGAYSPQGDSEHACADMAGNVLEWTQTTWGRDWEHPDYQYPYDPTDGREELHIDKRVFRILRGGSFISHVNFVRCTCRCWDLADSRDWYVGFRVARNTGLVAT